MFKSIFGLIAGATLACAALAGAAKDVAKAPVPVIFDTDIGNDVDDCLALAILHAFQSRGEARLIAVTITKENVWAARLASAINTYYGRPEIPIGVVKDGKTPDVGYLKKALDAGHYKYTDNAKDAVEVLRAALQKEADGSVVIVQVGFSTNLAHLLEAPGGKELAAKKVKRLVMMAGDFEGKGPEYNVVTDVPSAQKVAREWPTPIVWSGFEVGRTIKYPATSIERDFGPVGAHPVADAYRVYMKMPYDRETWDLTAAFYGVRPGDGYFTASPDGVVDVDAKGFTKFTPKTGGKHRILSVNDAQRARIREAFLWLCTQPPKGR